MIIEGKRNNSNVRYRKIYQTWYNIMARCYNPKNPYYKNYGGKGITVCERWHKFENFLEDFDKIKGFTEEIFQRKDVFLDKDGKNLNNMQYNIENCEFIDIATSNKRKQHQMKPFAVTIIDTDEKFYFVNQSECSRKLGISQSCISKALHKNNGQGGKYNNYFFQYTDI